MAGLTATGFEIKTTADIFEEMSTQIKAELGNVNTQADSDLGVMLGVVAGRIGSAWELAQSIYRAFDPDDSSDDALDGLSELTGAVREDSTPSTLTAAVDLDAGRTLTAGNQANVAGAPSRIFETDTTLTSSTIRKWRSVEMTATEDGPTVAEEGTLTEITTPSTGWDAVTNEPVPATRWSDSLENYALSDGQTLQLDVGAGTTTATFNTGEFVDIGHASAQEVADVINAETTGVLASDDGGRLKLEDSTDTGSSSSLEVVGGTAVTALGLTAETVTGVEGAAAELGALEETDAVLRARRTNELEQQGTGTGETLRAQLLELTGMLDVAVYENRTDDVDGDGLPAHSFRAVVFGTGLVDADVAQVVFDNSPLGIESYGSESATVYDSQGVAVTVYWDVASEVPIYVEADIDVIATTYVGDDEVKAAVAAYVNAILLGDDVIAEASRARLWQTGVYDVNTFLVDDVDPPVAATNISIGLDEVATLDVADIDLTSNEVTPS